MALLAVGAALMIAFGLALSLQWGLLAAIVHHMPGASGSSLGPTSSPSAEAS